MPSGRNFALRWRVLYLAAPSLSPFLRLGTLSLTRASARILISPSLSRSLAPSSFLCIFYGVYFFRFRPSLAVSSCENEREREREVEEVQRTLNKRGMCVRAQGQVFVCVCSCAHSSVLFLRLSLFLSPLRVFVSRGRVSSCVSPALACKCFLRCAPERDARGFSARE